MTNERLVDLLSRVRDGNDLARVELCEVLAEEWMAKIRRVLRRKGVSDSDLPDAIQEVNVRVIQNLVRIEKPGSVWFYIRRIAQHVARRYRRRRVEVELPDVCLGSRSPGLELSLDLRAALDRLPPRWRRAVELAYFEGLTSEEVSAALGVSPGRARTLVHRAILRLRVLMDVRIDQADADGRPVSRAA